MKLKNKAEREKFIKDYKSFELFKEIPEIEVKLYRKELNNGAVIIVTEYQSYVYSFEDNEYRKCSTVQYHLILPQEDEYQKNTYYGKNEFSTYKPSGHSIGTIIDYLTKNRDLIEV